MGVDRQLGGSFCLLRMLGVLGVLGVSLEFHLVLGLWVGSLSLGCGCRGVGGGRLLGMGIEGRSLEETSLGREGREGRLHLSGDRIGFGAFSGWDRVCLFVGEPWRGTRGLGFDNFLN